MVEISTNLLDMYNLEKNKLLKVTIELLSEVKFKTLLLYCLSAIIIIMFSVIMF